MLDELNQLAAEGITDFRFDSYDGSRLVIIGSFDLSYYHDVEITFTEVEHINCPTYFYDPQFSDAAGAEGLRRFKIKTPEGRWEIVALNVSVAKGKVYHYDRGSQLQPGERIAPWVKRSDG